MAIKFSQFNLRTDHTSGMYLVGYDGNQNIHITVDNLFDDFINGTENTIAMFGTDGTVLADSILSQNAGATLLTVAGQLNVDAAATFDTSIAVTGDSTLNGNVTLGDASTDLITQTGTLYLNGPVKDTTDTLGVVDQILVSDASGELTFQDLLATHVESAEVIKVPVKNVQGSALEKGDPVYISGTIGASGRLEVQLADASNAAKMPAVGLLFQDLANNEEGYVVVTGKLRNITTDPIDGVTPTEGDVVYVKPSGTSGAALTTTKPVYGNFIQNMGKVGRVSNGNSGTLVVSSILRSNDVPNLTPGKIWVGSTGNTIESSSITLTEATGAIQFNEYGAGTFTGTAVKNLAVDSSGNVIETDGNIIDGSGTANYVSKWSDANTLTDSVIYDDGTNVGIGTTSPSTKLDVNGNVIANRYYGSGSTTYYVDPNDTTQAAYLAGDIRIKDSGTATIKLDSTSIYPGSAIIATKNGSESPNRGELSWYENPGIQGSQWIARQSSSPYTASSILLPTSTNRDFEVVVYGTERFRVDSSTGNFGIGTTSPSQKLEVVGAAKLHGNLIFDDSYNVVGGDTLELQTGGSTKIVLDSADNGVLIDNGSGGLVSDTFKSNFDDNIFTGNVSISGDVGIDESIIHNGDVNTKFGFVANDNFAITTAGFERVRVTSGGSVGIGTNNPVAKLQVSGGVQVADDSATATADRVGTLRYRTSGNNSYVDMCMQTGASTYAWVNIVQNNW